MSLSTGRGPFSANPAGRAEPPLPEGVVYVEPHLRRVRGVTGGRTVIDTEAALLVHRQGHPPAYAFPVGSVDGVATEVEPAAPGFVQVPWDAVGEWYEEEEQVLGHPRNPYHRVDGVRATRRLRVDVVGVTLVDTDDVIGVYETSLAPKLYVRRELVRMDLLTPSSTTTYCPYKGTATYWHARIDGQPDAPVVEDVAWCYENPLPESLAIAGLLSFDPTKAEVDQDVPTAP